MGQDKLWAEVCGRPLVAHTLAATAAAGVFDRVVVATPGHNWEPLRALATTLGLGGTLELVAGGRRRQDSVRLALDSCGEAEIIVVHDAARPLCPPALFGDVITAARRHGAATSAIPLVDSVKRVDGEGRVTATLERSELVAVQTPQAFDTALLREAHRRAQAEGVDADDDCALVERLGAPVVVVPGDPRNLKVTRPQDLALMRALLDEAVAT
ncbi:MAG TPA: 2-C-methyl-D-erythritol 4-phosphate cytidylyltransferase [Candidatus Dormibacteraeota bacterium]